MLGVEQGRGMHAREERHQQQQQLVRELAGAAMADKVQNVGERRRPAPEFDGKEVKSNRELTGRSRTRSERTGGEPEAVKTR